jgi:hypothetical protein
MDTSDSSSSASSSASSSSASSSSFDLTNPDIIRQFRNRAEIETARERKTKAYVDLIEQEFGITQCIICNEFIQPLSNDFFIHKNSRGECGGKFHENCLKWLITPQPNGPGITNCPKCNEKFTEEDISNILNNNEDLCAICISPMGKTSIISTECGHNLHLECASSLHAHNPRAPCPTCRRLNNFIVVKAPTPPPPVNIQLDEAAEIDDYTLNDLFADNIFYGYVDPNTNFTMTDIIVYFTALLNNPNSILLSMLFSFMNVILHVTYINEFNGSLGTEINLNNFLENPKTITNIFLEDLITQEPFFLTINNFKYSPIKFVVYNDPQYTTEANLNNSTLQTIILSYCIKILQEFEIKIRRGIQNTTFDAFVQQVRNNSDDQNIETETITTYLSQLGFDDNKKKIFVVLIKIYIIYDMSDQNHRFDDFNTNLLNNITIPIHILCRPEGSQLEIIGTQIYRRPPDSIYSRIMSYIQNPFGRRGGKKRKSRKNKTKKGNLKKAKKGTHKRP